MHARQFTPSIDPGWVPAKMGGTAATGDLEMGSLTQTWLAVGSDAAATVSARRSMSAGSYPA